MSDILDGTEKGLGTKLSADAYAAAKKWFLQRDPKDEKLLNYWNGINEVLNFIQIMGMPEPKPITSVYVPLKIFPNRRMLITERPAESQIALNLEASQLEGADIIDIDDALESLGYGFLINETGLDTDILQSRKSDKHRDGQTSIIGDENSISSKDALEHIHGFERIVILGQPGGGKTTLLKYLALAYSGLLPNEVIQEPLIPIYLPLRDFSVGDKENIDIDSFFDFVIDCSTQITRSNNTEVWIKKQIADGHCILLVDGLDEVSENSLKPLLKAFGSFSNTYRKNKIVVTCRAAAYDHSLPKFNIVEVDDFSPEDVVQFARYWFCDNAKNLRSFTKDLRQSKDAYELCKTPLLTTLVCLMYDYSKRIPENRYELYESCVDAMMYKWDTFRSIERKNRVDSISNISKQYVISSIARQTFDKGQLYFSKQVLLGLISSELDRFGRKKVNASELLIDFEKNMGLIVEWSPNVYCFSHLTFHEFFAALSYLELKEVDLLLSLVYSNVKYREVFILALEKIYRPDKIVLTLAARIKHDYINKKRGSDYHQKLLLGILRSQSLVSEKVRKLLIQIEKELLFSEELS